MIESVLQALLLLFECWDVLVYEADNDLDMATHNSAQPVVLITVRNSGSCDSTHAIEGSKIQHWLPQRC